MNSHGNVCLSPPPEDFCSLVGWTIIGCSSADGDFEGESGDIVKLYNVMLFELDEDEYQYAYLPTVVILAKAIKYKEKDLVLCELIIEDEIYDASRIR